MDIDISYASLEGGQLTKGSLAHKAPPIAGPTSITCTQPYPTYDEIVFMFQTRDT